MKAGLCRDGDTTSTAGRGSAAGGGASAPGVGAREAMDWFHWKSHWVLRPERRCKHRASLCPFSKDRQCALDGPVHTEPCHCRQQAEPELPMVPQACSVGRGRGGPRPVSWMLQDTERSVVMCLSHWLGQQLTGEGDLGRGASRTPPVAPVGSFERAPEARGGLPAADAQVGIQGRRLPAQWPHGSLGGGGSSRASLWKWEKPMWGARGWPPWGT